MGASEEEYRRVAPHNSFIHVNQFPGPRELAEYLHTLDRDDDKYNQYFQVGSRMELKRSFAKRSQSRTQGLLLVESAMA